MNNEYEEAVALLAEGLEYLRVEMDSLNARYMQYKATITYYDWLQRRTSLDDIYNDLAIQYYWATGEFW